ncbi:MAG: thioesterase family protein [Aestuariivirgaceae bacterium]
MKPVETGASYQGEVWAKPADLASAIGNTGVDVVSSPATIGYLEMACHHVIDPHFEGDEASVGVGFNFRHLAAAHLGAPIEVTAELIEQTDRLFTFKVKAAQDGKTIMTGQHERSVINLDRFMKKTGQ